MGLAGLYGSTAAGAARGPCGWITAPSIWWTTLANQIKFTGIQPVVAEPQTNGVAERFNAHRTAIAAYAVRDFGHGQWIRLSPAQVVARRDLNQARRVRQNWLNLVPEEWRCHNVRQVRGNMTD